MSILSVGAIFHPENLLFQTNIFLVLKEQLSAECLAVNCSAWAAKMAEQQGENLPEQRNFIFCFRPIYYFARLCGQMPFTITSQATTTIVALKLYKRDFIWFAISLAIQATFIWMAINFYKSFRQAVAITSTIYFGNLTIWFMSLLFGIAAMALDACNRHKIVRILNQITIFDTEVRKSIDLVQSIGIISFFILVSLKI